MIVGERKAFAQIWEAVKDLKSVLILGCGTCVSVCQSGGEKEVGIEPDRLEMYHISASNSVLFAKAADEMTARALKLGPNPLKAEKKA